MDGPDGRGAPEVLVAGRCGVDVYPLQVATALEDVETFARFLGGSAANVAVAAARLGRRTALLSGVGDDPFGRFVRRSLRETGVDDRFVVTDPDHPTPVTFCEIFPPDDFPVWFYRRPAAPDLQLRPDDLDRAAVVGAALLWLTLTGLSEEPSRSAHHAALAARGRRASVLDLDYRPTFWTSADHAREQARRALPLVTVAVGNLRECEVATGLAGADDAAQALLDLGVDLAVVKLGPGGVLGRTREQRVVLPASQVQVVNGLGAGDAFGGSLADGLLDGLPLAELLERADAAGAIVASRLECSTAMPTAAEVAAHRAAHRGAVSGAPRSAVRTVDRPAPPAPPRRAPAAAAPARRPLATSYAEVTELRARRPEAVAQALAARSRRPAFLPDDGRLVLVAADHPARGALAARGRPDAMASRTELLDRLRAALARPGVDGVVATADVVEDLLLLGALEDKVVVASMNRGGLAGSAFELDDRMTAYDVPGVVASGFEAGKMLLRLDLDDRGTVATMTACARAVTDLGRAGRAALVEPVVTSWREGRSVVDAGPEAVIRSVHVAQGLGASSARTWLKLPVVAGMERVMEATTLPTLLRGGDAVAAPEETYESWRKALDLPAVRGLVAGRALLFPRDDDVTGAVDTAVAMVR